jgi:osmotically-inducible protein OsmY
MMNSNSTHKIVVGIALAAVFGVGVSVFAVRAKHDSDVAGNAAAPAQAALTDQSATDGAAPAQSAAVQAPTDQTAPASSAPPVAQPEGAPASDEPRPIKSKASDRADRHVATARSSGDMSGTRVASADTTSSAPGGATADAKQAPAQTAQEAERGVGPTATNNEPVASDNQITAAVKSEIATAAPNSDVNVTTTNGVVVLAGSVPSQNAVDQARQAAQRVPGVKQLDASALVVSNQ